jgi:hypothetical protein
MMPPQKARIEKAPKLNTSFHFSLSNVTDAILDKSGFIGQNGDELHPFIFEHVDQQNNVMSESRHIYKYYYSWALRGAN